MSGEQIPPALAAILREPGWEQHDSQRGEWFEYFGLNPDEQRGGHDVVQVYFDADDGWTCALFPFNYGVSARTVCAAAELITRIERALAGGAGAPEEDPS